MENLPEVSHSFLPPWHVRADHGLPATAAVFIILYIIDVTTSDFISCPSALLL